jgi:hypothetical protein
LVEANTLWDLPTGKPFPIEGLGTKFIVVGFPFGSKLSPIKLLPYQKDQIKVAVLHQYVWTASSSFPNAPRSAHVTSLLKLAKHYRYTHVVTGDNHLAFQTEHDGVTVFNCGSIINRNSDQRNYKPSVGILHDDGSIQRLYLDTSKDKWLAEDKIKFNSKKADLRELIEGFKKLSTDTIDFLELLEKHLDDPKVKSDVKKALLEIIEKTRNAKG